MINMLQLLNASLEELQLKAKKLQRQLAESHAYATTTSSIAGQSKEQSAELDEDDTDIDDEDADLGDFKLSAARTSKPDSSISNIEEELLVVNTLIRERNTQTEDADKLANLEHENATLRRRINRHKELESKIREYVGVQQDKQQQLTIQHSNAVASSLAAVAEIRRLYPDAKSYNGHLDHMLSWMSQKGINDSSTKAKVRKEQIEHLEQLADMLSQERAHGVEGDEFSALLMQISIKLGIGFQDSKPTTTEQLNLCETEKRDLINMIKALTLYGGLETVEQEIKQEKNIAPSRLLQLIISIKQQLQFDVYHLSNGLIDRRTITNRAAWAYNHFMAGIEFMKPVSTPKLQLSGIKP